MKYLFSPGHGGMAFCHYLTPGKQWLGLYEGEFNRDVCDILCQMHPDYLNIAPGPIRIPLMSRVRFVNKLAKKEDICLISVHANAQDTKGEMWGKARGHRVFVREYPSLGSVRLASFLNHELSGMYPGEKQKRIRERNFTIIKRTDCPSVMVELGFMTNKYDHGMLKSQNARKNYALRIHRAIQKFEAFISENDL